MSILITAEKYSLTPDHVSVGTRGSRGVETLEFRFSGDWDGAVKKVSFYPRRAEPVVVVLADGENTVAVPWEVNAAGGICRYVLSGTAGDMVILSLTGMLEVADTLEVATTPAGSPTPTEIEQVYGYMQTAIETAQSVRHDADSGEFDGADGAPGRDGRDGLDGAPGRQIELQKSATHIQWRYVGDTEWTELISLDELVVAGGGDAVPIATISVAGKVKVGDGLSIDADGTLSVDCATAVERDNTKPVTSGAVYTEVGNIAVLLAAL